MPAAVVNMLLCYSNFTAEVNLLFSLEPFKATVCGLSFSSSRTKHASISSNKVYFCIVYFFQIQIWLVLQIQYLYLEKYIAFLLAAYSHQFWGHHLPLHLSSWLQNCTFSLFLTHEFFIAMFNMHYPVRFTVVHCRMLCVCSWVLLLC